MKNILNFLPENPAIEDFPYEDRIFNFNNKPVKKGKIVYLMERELRLKENFALNYAKNISAKDDSELVILHPKRVYDTENKNHFIDNELKNIKSSVDFFYENDKELLKYLKSLPTAILIIDFNPIRDFSFLKNVDFKIVEIDSHNIIPAKFISNKQEYSAATFRKKVYDNIYRFFTRFSDEICDFAPLDEFIENKLDYYYEFKNNPVKDVTSNLSKYLTFGFISSKSVALKILRSKSSDINKNAFLEELIVRKELADNFCLYAKNFKTLESIPQWAKTTLDCHKNDIRFFCFSREEFEFAKTHDPLWNSAQIQLVKEGRIHGYMRMYWAKKILEWSENPQKAHEISIYLNDKYACDAPSANGYTGILWSIGALHDRAFGNRPVTGKFRPMTYNGAKSKFDVQKYINNYNESLG